MIQVWLYDENNIFIKSIFVNEIDENMTDIPLLIGYIKPMFNGVNWVEGATQEEINSWNKENRTKSDPTPLQKISDLEIKLLKLERGL